MSEEMKWEEEARKLAECFSPNLSYRSSFMEGYFQACRKREEEIKGWREFAWFHHGCSISSLYGDDGEMQCNAMSIHRPIDFKRDSLQEIIDKLHPDQAMMNKLIKEYLDKKEEAK